MDAASELVERKRRPRSERAPAPARPRPAVARASFVQRCIGNGHPGCACPDDQRVQPALAVGPAGDRYEQEAERLAARIAAAATAPVTAAGPTRVSRLAAGPAPAPAGPTVDGQLDHSGGHPLSAATRAFMEPRFGADFDAVRVHGDAGAQTLAGRLQARAFTHGAHIWLGAGAAESDRGLMAHELTHVLQQDGGSGAAVQRQPACKTPTTPRNVDVYLVSLPGSTRDPYADVTRANSIWAQCAINVNVVGGRSWSTNLMDQDAPAGVLNEYSAPGSPTAEETTMLAHQPGGAGAIYAYYVPALSSGSRGESFWPADFPTVPAAVAISDSAASDSFAHELGHVLLNSGDHHVDADNLMATGTVRNVGVDKLECAQCK
jgi:Domain of unknown function (DUF4157)